MVHEKSTGPWCSETDIGIMEAKMATMIVLAFKDEAKLKAAFGAEE
jgi:hypothetical protein